MNDELDAAVRWLFVALAGALAGFALVAVDLLDLAVFVGIATSLVFAVAGVRVSAALSDLEEDERLDYPYHLAQRGRRLALAGLTTAAGLSGYGLAPTGLEAAVGPVLLVLAGGAAIVGPVGTLALALWVIDGIELVTGADAGGPVVAAVFALSAALLLAFLAATAGVPANLLVLAVLGGVLPAGLLLWGLARLSRGLDAGGPPA